MKRLPILILLFLSVGAALAQPAGRKELTEAANKYLRNYKVDNYVPVGRMQADSVLADDEERELRVYTNENFYSQPFTPESVKRIRKELIRQFPAPYNTYKLFVFDGKGQTIEELIPNVFREGDEDSSRLWGGISFSGIPWVTNLSRPYAPSHGLSGRHLFVWPSHGRYNKYGKWAWQRPYLFCTTEDLLTQSFVYPFLFPMLENAGAIVCCPRERDVQSAEAVVDNDANGRQGSYEEQSQTDCAWSTAPDSAFALPAGLLLDSIQPFRLGTARIVPATTRRTRLATATWTPRIPKAGRYAVYVSYPSRPNSVQDARYAVYHKGGRTLFRVNQQMGGGTWVYLGTFDFDEGSNRHGRVVLTNQSDYRGVVGADGVRFGGGTGQSERGEAGTSGLPRFLEAARYHTQWCGLPDTLYNTEGGLNDYTDDLRCRSNMLNLLGGGSPYMPHLQGRGVPFEMSLALHTDAGIRPDRSVYGTLAICTTADAEGVRQYGSGLSRAASADLGSILLASVTGDLSARLGTSWTRRELWDRNYSETRSPAVPSAILEMLSHQNYTDMKYAHDPEFKFLMARAVYKAVLRFVSHEHGEKRPAVQPLPVGNFAALLTDDGSAVELSWTPTLDSLEKSARPTAYVVYTKQDGGSFDNGRLVEGRTAITLPLSEGVQYSFKVTAVNQGGESFPSETLSAYKAPGEKNRLLIINGFRRVSGPARVETPDSLGFDLRKDIGVPYLYTTAFAGRQKGFDPRTAGSEGPGSLGYCGQELEGLTIAGNTFDYPETHGRAIAATPGHSYSSCSREAAVNGSVRLSSYAMVDYIAGLEKDAPQNLRPYKAFPKQMRDILGKYLEGGGSLLISGAYIASDMQLPAERQFTEGILKYRYAGTDTIPAASLGPDSISASPGYDNTVRGLNLRIPLRRTLSADHYFLQAPDALLPADPGAFTAFAYSSGLSAGIAYKGPAYRVIATGFPFECISDETIRKQAMGALIRFLTQ